MAKKVLLKDKDEELLPITRGELVLDSSGLLAFHSNEFLATTTATGLLSNTDKSKLDNLSTTLGNYVTIDTDQTITGTKTFTKQLKFTVAQGTAPFTVTSTTKVANLNADYLDGLSSNSFARVSYNESLDANDILDGVIGGKLYGAFNFPHKYYPFLSVGLTKYKMLFNGYANELKYRAGDEDGLDTKVWRTVAFTDSNITGNAATADKLKTKRKLWGLDFDGTADVKGTITIGSGLTDNKSIQFLGGEYLDGSGNFHLNGTNEVENAFHIFKTSSDGTRTSLFSVSDNNSARSAGTFTAPTFKGNLNGTYINKLTGYAKATAIGSIAATDSLNSALGKLEFKTDFIYNDLFGTDNDDVINKWHEIVDFIDSVKEGTDITDEFVTRKTALTITGEKTFDNFLRFVPTAIGGHAYGLSNIDSAGDNNTKRTAGIGFLNNSGIFAGAYIGWGESPWSSANNLYVNSGQFTYKNLNVLHAGNSHITNGVITINGVSITPLTLHQSLANYLPLSGGTMKKDAYISWNASEYGDSVSDWSTVTGHGLRIISSTTENSNAPTTYCTALHVRGSYGFKLASLGGATSNKFFIQNIANNTWNELIHSSNYETILNEKYLPLSGGTLTGTLISRQIKPSSNNSYSLGTSDRKWSNLYATNIYSNAIYNGTIIYASNNEIIHADSSYFELNKGYPNTTMWMNASAYKLKLGSKGVQFMIDANGNVGIGNVGGAPSYKLHVGGGEVMADTYHAWSGGFKKNGSSNSYVLLGGGGHKALSDFLLETEFASKELSSNLITITKSLKLTKNWLDTGITLNANTFIYGSGTYAVQVYIVAGSSEGFWHSYFSGIMSVYADYTNGDVPNDEIVLHHSSHASGHHIYLKTKPTTGGAGYYSKLYIACNKDFTAARNIQFKFKKLI